MKLTLACLLFICLQGRAQDQKTAKNVFIITTDGFRWEELFGGADSLLINDPRFVKDTALTKLMFWDSTELLRRKKLMPFFWNVIARQGQLYGNRALDNKVNVKNFYKISYPGYNEILTGFADLKPVFNSPVLNRNTNLLEYLNNQPGFKGKIAAFSSWNIMPFIFNEQRGGFPVNSGYEMLDSPEEESRLIDSVQEQVWQKNNTRHDQLTFLSAKEYIEKEHPRVVFMGLGETDECAHHGRYDMYLQKAAAVDKMIADLWYYLQTDPFYKDNTCILITTDHGRGKGRAWRTHGFWVKGSGEAWLAMLGSGILPEGELVQGKQIWQKQIAATVAGLLGKRFNANHPVAAPIVMPVAGNGVAVIGMK